MTTLYRKYRPQNFDELLGQNHVKITLQHEIETEKIAHAYLFCGPRAVGKTTVSRLLAKSINCLEKKKSEYNPCDKCVSCREISEGRSVDILEVDAASHTGVENVRENIIAASRISPTKLKNKVFIIDEAHMLSTPAFNALLKTMEEPPANVVFILCTTEVHKIPSTIISRCQRFDFKKISVSDIVNRLDYIADQEGIKIDRKILEAIARNSEGHMRDAISLLGQVVSIGGKEITREEADLVIPRSDLLEAILFIKHLTNKDAGSAIVLINKLVDDGVDLKTFLNDLIELLRKIMLSKINPSLAEKLAMEMGETVEIEVSKVSEGINVRQAVSFLEKFIETKNKLKDCHIAQLPIEVAIVELCVENAPVAPAVYQSASRKINITPINTGQRNVNQVAPSVETASVEINKNINLSQAELTSKWGEILARVKKYNHSLVAILGACQPQGIINGRVTLLFRYEFHRARINDPVIRSIIIKVLQEVFNENLDVVGQVDIAAEIGNFTATVTPEENVQVESNVPQKEGDDKTVENLLKNFGGKVVE
ncbi:MAG: DNA polymerase III subunit gamma/tau [bacterium]